jgi:hypothetical protein
MIGASCFSRHCRFLQCFGACATLLVVLGEAQAANPRVKEVIVVFKTHFDIGYTDLATNVLNRYRTAFVDNAVKLIDDSKNLPSSEQFVWTVPGWPLKQMLWSGQTSRRRSEIIDALKEGRLAVHALPFNTQTESLDLEDLVRGLTFSADLARENGLPLPRAAKMTDVPEHTWIMPTLLKHAGVNFFQIGCNSGSSPMRVPPLFWWEGPDGSRLLTSYSPRYGTELMPPQDWPYHTWLALIVAGDNHGPPTADEIETLLKQAATELPGVKIRFGRLEDFYDAIMAEKNPEIPVVRGDMPDTWIHGFEAMPIETKISRNVRPDETALGTLDTELRAWGLKPAPVAKPLAKAYEESLLYSEHTFGFDSARAGWRYGADWQKARAEGKYALFERSFEDKRGYIRNAAAIVAESLNERMALLAHNVKSHGPHIVVFNPLPWQRGGEVEVNTPGGTLHFFAKDVPPCGYKTFKLPRGAQEHDQAGTARIQNKFFRLQVDPIHGCISSLIDVKAGRELTASKGQEGLGQFMHERFSKTNVMAFVDAYTTQYARNRGWAEKDFGKPNLPGPDQLPYARITPSNWRVSTLDNAFGKTLVLRMRNAEPVAKSITLKYTLCHDRPYLDIEWAITDKTPNPIPEGGWLCLPFAIDHPTFKLGRLGSIIDPARDIISGGNRHLLCLNSGMTVTGRDGYGVGLCPLDSPLVSLDQPGLWKFSLDFVPSRARVYVNLYNNQWDTNFPLWQDGSWSSRVRVWVVRKDDDEKGLITPSWEARQPLLAAFAANADGKLPAEATGLALSRRGVLVTNYGPDPYSDKTLLRVWEVAGHSGSLTATLPSGLNVTRATPVNLRGEPEGAPVKISHSTFNFNLPAFAPRSFVLDGGTEHRMAQN